MVDELYESSLNEVYKKYYTADDGKCKYFAECRKGHASCDGLFCNRAKIGNFYGNGTCPKILVIGKEPVTENKTITRTATLEEANNPHYRRTLYTLAAFLEEEPSGDSYDELKKYEELLDYFCLTNYFKCSFTEVVEEGGQKKAKTNSNKKASKAMCENCWNILIDEINALKPEIIIIQGTSYSDDFWKQIESLYGESSLPKGNYKKAYEELTKHNNGPNGQPLYIVWAYHPTARAKFAWSNRLDNLRYILKKLKESIDAKESKT